MIVIALSVLLSFSDPLNDANGDGSLRQPTAPVYRSSGALDITEFDLLEGEDLGFILRFSSLSNPHDLPQGFSLPILELYIEDKDGGAGVADLLPGSSMSLPEGETWHYAFQLSGDAVRVYGADPAGGYEEISSSANPDLSVEGSALRLETNLELPENLNVYGVVGNYSAFSPTGWQALSPQASPWAYSSATQRRPVVDVLALTPESQALAIQQGVLPAIQTSRVTPPSYWVYVMLAGILLGIVGVAGRFTQPKTQTARSLRKNPAYRPTTQTFDIDAPDIDWEAPQLNRNISEVVATGVVREKPASAEADARTHLANPAASNPKTITFKPGPETDKGETAEDFLRERATPRPRENVNPNEVIDLRTLSEAEPKITRVQPPSEPVKREPVGGSSFKIDDFDLDEVIAQDDANVRQPSLAQEAPTTSAANFTDMLKDEPTGQGAPAKPSAEVNTNRPEVSFPEFSGPEPTQPVPPKTPENPLKAPAPRKAELGLRPAPISEPLPNFKPPVEPATPHTAASKPASSKPIQQPDSSKILTDLPLKDKPNASGTLGSEKPATLADTQTVSFSAKPVKPELSKAAELPTETLTKEGTTASHDDNLEIYSLKQALKKLKPKDSVKGEEDSSA